MRALLVARHNLKDEDESKKENLDDNIAQSGQPSSLTPLVYYRLSVDVHYRYIYLLCPRRWSSEDIFYV